MNELPTSLRLADRRPVEPASSGEDYIDLQELLRAALRQAWVVVLCVVLFAGLAIFYALSLQPKFTSYATVLLDQDRAQLVELISEQQTDWLRDGIVQSEVEILKSQELALLVVDRLGLVDRPEAIASAPSPVSVALGAVKEAAGAVVESLTGGPEPAPPEVPLSEETRREALRERLALSLRGQLSVHRVGRSYVIGVSVLAASPELAQEIAEGYVETYLDFGRAGDAAALDSAVAWLRQRTDDLRRSASEAGRALEEYRLENGLVSVGTRLLSEQQVSELMSQVIQVDAEASAARAVAAHAADAVAAGPEEALTNLAGLPSERADPAVAALRSEYVQLSGERARVAERFGEDHREVATIDRRLASVKALLFEEVERRANQARAQADVQTRRVAALREGLTEVTQEVTGESGARYELLQLQETAESYKALYQSALTRLERTVNQLSLPIVAARVLTAPDKPTGASSPQKAKFAAIGIVLGGLVGGLVGLLRELTRNTLTGAEQIRRGLGLPVVATLAAPSPWWRALAGGRGERARLNALRAMKVAVDAHAGRSGLRTVAFLSARPGEERGRLAFAFAQMLAEHDIACLYLDISQEGRRPAHGYDLVDVFDADDPPTFDDLLADADTPLAVLPGGPAQSRDVGEAAVFAGSERMAGVIAAVSEPAQYIVLDLPAASEGPAALAFAEYAQTALLVHRAGRARDRELQALALRPEWDERLCGAVLIRR